MIYLNFNFDFTLQYISDLHRRGLNSTEVSVMVKIVDQTDGDVPYAVDMYNGGHVHTWISLDLNKDDGLDPRECTCLRSFTGRDYVRLGEAMPGRAASAFLEAGGGWGDWLLGACRPCMSHADVGNRDGRNIQKRNVANPNGYAVSLRYGERFARCPCRWFGPPSR